MVHDGALLQQRMPRFETLTRAQVNDIFQYTRKQSREGSAKPSGPRDYTTGRPWQMVRERISSPTTQMPPRNHPGLWLSRHSAAVARQNQCAVITTQVCTMPMIDRTSRPTVAASEMRKPVLRLSGASI